MASYSAQRFPVAQKPQQPDDEEDNGQDDFGENPQQRVMHSLSAYGQNPAEAWNRPQSHHGPPQQHPGFQQRQALPAEAPRRASRNPSARRAPSRASSRAQEQNRRPVRNKKTPDAPPAAEQCSPSSATTVSLLKAQNKTLKHILGAMQKLIIQSNDNNVKLTTVMQEGFDRLSKYIVQEPTDSITLAPEEPWSEDEEELNEEDLAFVASEDEMVGL